MIKAVSLLFWALDFCGPSEDDTARQQLGEFCCRWTVVIAAAGIVTGAAALVLLGAVAVAASAVLCGDLATPFSKWVDYSALRSLVLEKMNFDI